MQYIIDINYFDAKNIISQINNCKGFPTPDGLTQTWMIEPQNICEFNFENNTKQQIGYGVIIKDEIMDCLTTEQKAEIITLSGNIQLCSYIPIIPSGTTINQ